MNDSDVEMSTNHKKNKDYEVSKFELRKEKTNIMLGVSKENKMHFST